MQEEKKDNIVSIEDGFNPFQGLTSKDLEDAMYALQMPNEEDAVPELVEQFMKEIDDAFALREKYTMKQIEASSFVAERRYLTEQEGALEKLEAYAKRLREEEE